MTKINIATDIPSDIDTLEKLVAWGFLALTRCNPTLKINESAASDPVRAALMTLGKADDGTTRLIGRVSLSVSDDYLEAQRKFWQNVLELDNVVLPAAFKVK